MEDYRPIGGSIPCSPVTNTQPLRKRSREPSQALPESEPKRPSTLGNRLGESIVPYSVQGDKPVFRCAPGKNRLCSSSPEDEDIQGYYTPEPALKNAVLADEIAGLSKNLFFQKGLKCDYNAKESTLSLDFSELATKSGKTPERCLIPMLLGADFIKNARNLNKYEPSRLIVHLQTGLVVFHTRSGEAHEFSLPFQCHSNEEYLDRIYRLLLARQIAERILSAKTLEQVQASQYDVEKQTLLKQLDSDSRLLLDDPERLGFRLSLKETRDGTLIELTDIDHEQALKLWGTDNKASIMAQLRPLFAQVGISLSSDQQDASEELLFSSPLHQLASHLESDAVTHTGVLFLDKEGRILRAPFIPGPDTPWASPGGSAKVRLDPLGAAVVESCAEDSILPANLDCWHRLPRLPEQSHQELPEDTPPEILWENLTQQAVTSSNNTPSGIYQDKTTGASWHIKWYGDNEDRARNETLATKLYQAAGVATLERHTLFLDGEYCTVSPAVTFDHEHQDKTSRTEIFEGFVADAWLANWDVGSSDNICMTAGKYHRVDCGGALRYRAGEELKQSTFSRKTVETDTFLDAFINPRTAKLFQQISLKQKLAGAHKVIAIPRQHIESLVRQHGPRSAEAQERLIETLLCRQEDIARQFPQLGPDFAALYAVEPAGYDLADGPFDSGYPVKVFDNEFWRWFSFEDFRQGRLDDHPLRRDCSELFAYLAYEERRIEASVQPMFPGMSVRICGAHADIEDETPDSGITETHGGFLPTHRFGKIILEPQSSEQATACESWLQGLGLSVTRNQAGSFEISENPYRFFRRVSSESRPACWQESHRCGTCAYSKALVRQRADDTVNLETALSSLDSLREKIAVAANYRDHLKTSGQPTNLTEEQPVFSSLDSFIPLYTEDTENTGTEKKGEGLYCHKETGQWYRLKSGSKNAVCNEVLMGSLAASTGLPVPTPQLVVEGGKRWAITAWQTGFHAARPSGQPADQQQLARLFLTAAWLGNDTIARHTGVNSNGDIVALNWCHAGPFTHNRKRKHPDENNEGGFFSTVFELETLRDPDKNPAAAQLFSSLSESSIAAVMPDFLESAAQHVSELVERYGPLPKGEKAFLAKTLFERLGYLALRYPDNLPRITAPELQAIAANGQLGYEVPVNSSCIADRSIRIGHRYNPSGEEETQVCLRLTEEKTGELARALQLGQSHHDLQSRLCYFLNLSQKTMNGRLRQDIQETLDQANSVLTKMLTAQKGDLQYGKPDQSADALTARVEGLKHEISELEQLLSLPDGTELFCQFSYDPEPLPVFFPQVEKLDWKHSLPEVLVEDGHYTATTNEIPFKGNVYLHRYHLQPGEMSGLYPSPEAAIVVEFHGPDTSAYSFEGQVRLTIKGHTTESIHLILDWLGQLGIDCSRPDSKAMQVEYMRQLTLHADEYDMPPANKQPRWEEHTRLENGQLVRLLPEASRLPKNESEHYCAYHRLNFLGGDSNRFSTLLNRGAQLLSYTDRVNAGVRCDQITNPQNITTNAGNLVFTTLIPIDRLQHKTGLIFKPSLLNRMDLVRLNCNFGQSQPWYARHEIRRQEEMLKISAPQCNFYKPVSLPESLACIQVNSPHDKAEVCRDLKSAGFTIWPNGHPVEDMVVVTRTLWEQYNQLCSPLSSLAKAEREVLRAIGFSQFGQLLKVNPDLEQDGLVSLKGIRLKNLTITGLNIANIALEQAEISNVTFLDCEIVGANLSGFDREDIHWRFSDSNQHADSISYLSAHLEQQFCTRNDSTAFTRLIRMQVRTGRYEAAFQLMRTYQESLPPQVLLNCIHDVFDELFPDSPSVCQASVLRCLDSLQVQSPELLFYKLRWGQSLGDDHLKSVMMEANLENLCQIYPSCERLSCGSLCLMIIKERVMQEHSYEVLSTLPVLAEIYDFLGQWFDESPEPMIFKALTRVSRTSMAPAVELLDRFKLCQQRYPGNKVLKKIKLSDICYLDSHLTLDRLLSSPPEKVFKQFLILAKGGTSSQMDEKKWLDYYQLGLCFWPDKSDLYFDFITAIKHESLSGSAATPEQYMLDICARGLRQFSDAPATTKQLLAKIRRGITGEQVPEFLFLTYQYQSPDEALRQFRSLSKKLRDGDLECNNNNQATVDTYFKALELWPDTLKIYTDFITLIEDENLTSGSGEDKLETEALILSICKRGLTQFSQNPRAVKKLFSKARECLSGAMVPEFLEVCHQCQDSEKAWSTCQKLLKEIEEREIDCEGQELIKIYQKALDLWPDKPELYTWFIRDIEEYDLEDESTEPGLNSDELIFAVCKKGVEQFKATPEHQKLLLDKAIECIRVWSAMDTIKMVQQVQGEDSAWTVYQTLIQKMDSYEIDCDDLECIRFFNQLLDFWPDKPEVYTDFISMTEEYCFEDHTADPALTWYDLIFRTCQKAIVQFRDNPDIQKQMLEKVSEPMSAGQVADFVLLTRQIHGADQAWATYQWVLKEIEREAMDCEGEDWVKIYNLLLASWPEKAELYIDFIKQIGAECLVDESITPHLNSSQYVLSVCRWGLAQLPADQNVHRQLLEEARKHLMGEEMPEYIWLVSQHLGNDEACRARVTAIQAIKNGELGCENDQAVISELEGLA